MVADVGGRPPGTVRPARSPPDVAVVEALRLLVGRLLRRRRLRHRLRRRPVARGPRCAERHRGRRRPRLRARLRPGRRARPHHSQQRRDRPHPPAATPPRRSSSPAGSAPVGGVLLGAGVAWPVFLLRQPYLAFPLFGFVVVVLGYVGFVIGASKRDGVLAMFGDRAGLGPRAVAAAALPRIVDTSVAIDGRILDVVRAGFLHGTMLVPTPVLGELQAFADAGDDARRAKGRRGLEVLEALQREPGRRRRGPRARRPRRGRGRRQAGPDLPRPRGRAADPRHQPGQVGRPRRREGAQPARPRPRAAPARWRPARTSPSSCSRRARSRGQAVGYLDDGSMVVVEQPGSGSEPTSQVHVTSVLTTANGRLVFGRLAGAEDLGHRCRRAARRRTIPVRRPAADPPARVID